MATTIELGPTPEVIQLIQQLASNIGVSVETLFPWFVAHEHLTGIVYLVVMFICLMFGGILIMATYKKADFNSSDLDIHTGICCVGVVTLLATFAVCCAILPLTVSKIMVPEYHATQELVKSVATLGSK